MTYIYFDESGDLGFDFAKKGTSGQFSVAFLILTNKRPVSSAVKKVFLSLPISKVRKHTGELHAYKERASTRRKLLANLATKDILIATMRLDKKKVLIADNPHDLYASIVNSLVNRLFVDGVINGSDPIQLIASRRDTSQTLNRRFSESVASSATTARVNTTPSRGGLGTAPIRGFRNERKITVVHSYYLSFWCTTSTPVHLKLGVIPFCYSHIMPQCTTCIFSHA